MFKRIKMAHDNPYEVTEHKVKVIDASPKTQSLKSRLFGTSNPTDYVIVEFKDGYQMAVRGKDLY